MQPMLHKIYKRDLYQWQLYAIFNIIELLYYP